VKSSEDVLLLNLTRMGDLIQTTPLAVGLSRAARGAKVAVCVVEEFLPAARLMDGVDEIIPLDYEALARCAADESAGAVAMVRRAEEMLAPVLGRSFRMAINLTHSPASSVLMYLVNAADKRGMQMTSSGHRTIRHPWMLLFGNFAHNKQITPFNLVDIYALGGGVPNHRERIPLSIRTPPEASEWAKERIREDAPGEGPLVAVQTGASDSHKMWHPVSFIRLCRILRDAAGARFLFLGGPKERGLVEKIAAAVDAPGSAVMAGRTDLPRLCGLLGLADLMITNDTGPMHLAAASGTPILSFAIGPVYYCNTGPYGEGHVVFQPRVSCAPCSFAVRCVNPECKEKVSPEAVAEVALRRLRKEPLAPGSLPDGPAFSGCEVYLSGRGDDGLIDYLPLLDRPKTMRFALERAYRRVWGDALLSRADPCGGEIPAPSSGEGLFPPLKLLEGYAGEGLAAAREIRRRSGMPGRNIGALRSGLVAIRGVSSRIRELGMAVPELNGLCLMFAYEEENMKASDLSGAARENVEIFGNLLRRTRSLAYLLSGSGEETETGRTGRCGF
jgi:ADP-heptose:LPS heptosyltransferase